VSPYFLKLEHRSYSLFIVEKPAQIGLHEPLQVKIWHPLVRQCTPHNINVSITVHAGVWQTDRQTERQADRRQRTESLTYIACRRGGLLLKLTEWLCSTPAHRVWLGAVVVHRHTLYVVLRRIHTARSNTVTHWTVGRIKSSAAINVSN